MVLSYGLWLAAVGVETALLIHLLRLQLVSSYPFFSAYLTLVWASSTCAWVTYHQGSAYYPWVYWIGEFLTVLAGFLVVWETFRHTLQSFPTIRRRLSWLILFLLLLLLVAQVLLGGFNALHWDHLFFGLARWLRFLQAGLLAAVLGAARYYGLPLGRNVSGMAIGYGLYTSLTVVNFVSQALARIDLTQFSQLYAGTYLLTLAIWCYALWVYAPNPAPLHRAHLEQDYARLNAIVAGALLQLRGSWRKAGGA